jgi:hypothetical protein
MVWDLIKLTLFFLALGAFLFGVSINGTRYGLSCNEQDGVGIHIEVK